MRKNIQNPDDKVGQTRIRKYFALFPVRINNEVRWLEFVKIEQIFTYHWGGMDDGDQWFWENVKFVD